jgi:hypothetical protein
MFVSFISFVTSFCIEPRPAPAPCNIVSNDHLSANLISGSPLFGHYRNREPNDCGELNGKRLGNHLSMEMLIRISCQRVTSGVTIADRSRYRCGGNATL